MRVKTTMEIRTRAIVFYEEGIRSAREIGALYSISETYISRVGLTQHFKSPFTGSTGVEVLFEAAFEVRLAIAAG